MHKTTKEDFEIFRKEAKKYIDIFELNNWEVAFAITKKEGVMGSCEHSLQGYTATLFLCNKWEDEIKPCTPETIKETAKHEVIHLLLGRFSECGEARFVNRDELNEAEEELVRRLEFIIK